MYNAVKFTKAITKTVKELSGQPQNNPSYTGSWKISKSWMRRTNSLLIRERLPNCRESMELNLCKMSFTCFCFYWDQMVSMFVFDPFSWYHRRKSWQWSVSLCCLSGTNTNTKLTLLHLQAMKMIFFKLFLIYTFKLVNFGRKKVKKKKKKIELHEVHGVCFSWSEWNVVCGGACQWNVWWSGTLQWILVCWDVLQCSVAGHY